MDVVDFLHFVQLLCNCPQNIRGHFVISVVVYEYEQETQF